MLRNLSVFLSAVLLLILPTLSTGQDTPTPSPRLKQPTVDEYLAQVDEIIAKAETQYTAGTQEYTLTGVAEIAALFDEINWRYLDQGELSYEQMRSLIRALPIVQRQNGYREPDWLSSEASRRWLPALIDRWLAEHPEALNFDIRQQVSFDDISMTVTPLLDGDAYLLDVVENPTGLPNRYVAMKTPDGIVVPPLPVSIDSEILASGDLNGDGKPDFAYLSDYTLTNTVNVGSVVILSWMGHKFEVLTSLGYQQAPYVMNVSWQFLNVDEDPQTEVIQNQLMYDTFDCSSIHITSFDWDDEQELQPNSEEVLLPAGFHCLLRKAEEAVWAGHYDAAIESYQQTLTFPTEDDKRFEYAQMRLALAYLFKGDADKAAEMFADLHASEGSLAAIAQQAYEADSRPLAVCQTVYNWLFEANHRSSLYEISLGTLDEVNGAYYGRPRLNGPSVIPNNTACDLTAWIRAAVTDMTFSVSESPLEKLESLGLRLGGAGSTDFDGDGDDEWLVWVDAIGTSPILFVPDGDVYSLSSSLEALDAFAPSGSLRLPSQYNQYSVISLPDGSGKALVNVNFDIDRYNQIGCPDCAGGPEVHCPAVDRSLPRLPGNLLMYRMENGVLVQFFYAPLCSLERIDQKIINGDVFRGVEALRAGYAFAEYGEANDRYESFVIMDVPYVWDTESKTFTPQLPPTPTPLPTPTPVPTYMPPTAEGRGNKIAAPEFSGIRYAFQQGNYLEALDRIDSILAIQPGPNYTQAYRYYRALILEAQEKYDEAAAEYALIYEASPESAWGMLAKLHLDD